MNEANKAIALNNAIEEMKRIINGDRESGRPYLMDKTEAHFKSQRLKKELFRRLRNESEVDSHSNIDEAKAIDDFYKNSRIKD